MNNELFTSGQHFFQNTQSIHDLMKALPSDVAIAVRLDRIEGTLKLVNNEVTFTEGYPQDTDLEVSIGTETLRRWEKSPPDEITQLVLGFLSEVTLGHSKIVTRKPLATLREKGYLQIFEKLAPKVQGELLQKGMMAIGTAQSTLQMGVETAKLVAKSMLSEYFGKKK
ncbi:MAG: hypothetical protein AABZ31_02325 [Bdellovibrionota bacterium]